MEIGIMGAGAIGCCLGMRLHAAGYPVRLVGSDSLAQEVRRHGLLLTDYDERRISLAPEQVSVATSAAGLTGCAMVLVTVKSLDTHAAAHALAPYLAADALIVSFQNGIQNPDILRQGLSAHPVLAGMVPFNVTRRSPTHFHQGTSGSLFIEEEARAAPLMQALRAAGFLVVPSANMNEILWGKLIINLNNAFNALLGMPLREQIANPLCRKTLAAVMEEALGVLHAGGIRPARAGKVIPWLMPKIMRLPNFLFLRLAAAMAKIDPVARSSMWEDLSRGRPTEIDFLNGEIVSLGRKLGHPTPLNERIVELVKQAEQRKTPSCLSPEQLARVLQYPS